MSTLTARILVTAALLFVPIGAVAQSSGGSGGGTGGGSAGGSAGGGGAAGSASG